MLHLARKILDLGYSDFKIFMRGSKVYQEYVRDIEEEINILELNNHIVFEPFEKAITLEEIYLKFDVMLLLSEYEGFGLPVLEAQSHGVPVVCSRIAIFEEILKQSAFYVNTDFTANEVEILIARLSDKSILAERAYAGFRNVNRFSWGEMSYETLSLYQAF